MARDRQAEAARRDARAQAAGYTSYGQMYRAQKAGYTGDGKGWNNQLDAKRAGAVHKSKGGVHVAGYTSTKAGAVISARRDDPKQMAALERELKRYGDRRRASFTFTPDGGGQTRTYGRHGGVSVGELKSRMSGGGLNTPAGREAAADALGVDLDAGDLDDLDADDLADLLADAGVDLDDLYDDYDLGDYLDGLDDDFYSGSAGGSGMVTVTIG